MKHILFPNCVNSTPLQNSSYYAISFIECDILSNEYEITQMCSDYEQYAILNYVKHRLLQEDAFYIESSYCNNTDYNYNHNYNRNNSFLALQNNLEKPPKLVSMKKLLLLVKFKNVGAP